VSERLAVEVEKLEWGFRLRVGGRLGEATVPVLAGVLNSLRREGADVEVDLEQVVFIDGAGLGLLLDAEADSELEGRRLAVTGVRESLLRGSVGAGPPQ
jgi:anti-anti-sigma factor